MATDKLPVMTENTKGKWEMPSKISATLCKRPPVLFSEDSQCIFCIVGNNVSIYSAKTGHKIGSLEGHSDEVTGIALNPRNALQLYTCSRDYTIRRWDYMDENVLQTWILDTIPLRLNFQPGGRSDKERLTNSQRLFFLSDNTLDASYSLCWLNVETDEINRCMDFRSAVSYFFSSYDPVFGFGNKKRFYIYDLNTFELIASTSLGKYVTVAAFNPTNSSVAIGSANGKIVVWWYRQKTITEAKVLRWHPAKVSCLRYSSDGAYLLSAGYKPVLVIWQLSTGAKQFDSTINSRINWISISPNARIYLIGCYDGSIRLIDSRTRKFIRAIKTLKQNPVTKSNLVKIHPATGLVPCFFPGKNEMVWNSDAGSIQFHDIERGVMTRELDICGANKIVNHNRQRSEARTVTDIAFTHRSEYMASVDMRKLDGLPLEVRITIWVLYQRRPKLITLVHNPHADRVTGLAAHPTRQEFATVSLDGTFKLWKLVNAKKRSWGCISTGTYHDTPGYCCGFSKDGSLLVVVFGQAITLWNPATLSLISVIGVDKQELITKLVFIECKGAPYLVTISNTSLSVWNLLSLTLWWRQDIACKDISGLKFSGDYQVEAIARAETEESNSETFAVLYSHGDRHKTPDRVGIFTVTHSNPLWIWCLGTGNAGRGVVYVKKANHQRHILLMDDAQELIEIREYKEKERKGDEPVMDTANEEKVLDRPTPFDAIYGKLAAKAPEKASTQPKSTPQQWHRPDWLREIENVPSHVVSAPSAWFDGFMNGLMKDQGAILDESDKRQVGMAEKTEEITEEGEKVEEEEEVGMEMESEEQRLVEEFSEMGLNTAVYGESFGKGFWDAAITKGDTEMEEKVTTKKGKVRGGARVGNGKTVRRSSTSSTKKKKRQSKKLKRKRPSK